MIAVPKNSTTNVTLPAGSSFKTLGDGFAVVAGQSQPTSLSSPGVIGPFQSDKVISITATGDSFGYDYPQMAFPVATSNVSSSGGYLPGTPDGNGSGDANSTRNHVVSAWGEYNAVQLVFLNRSGSASTVENYTVAVGSTIYPSGVNNIAAPSGSWASPKGAVTIPAGTQYKPGMFVTPKIPLKSVARAVGELDGGKYPLLYVRCYIGSANSTASYAGLPAAWASKWNPVNEGFTLQTAIAYGADYVTTPGPWNAATGEDSPAVTFFGVIYTYDRKHTTVCSIGDSIWAGNGDGVTGICPFGFKATARIRASGKYCAWQSGGIGGSQITQINLHGKDIIANLSPDIIIIPSYTINSAMSTQDDWDSQWFSVMDLAQAQLALGRQVLLVTPLPNNFLSQAQNVFRIKQRSRVINSRIPFVDVESLVGASGSWVSASLTADGTHPTPLGHEALASLVQPVLDKLIA